jgi:hypothetical protein
LLLGRQDERALNFCGIIQFLGPRWTSEGSEREGNLRAKEKVFMAKKEEKKKGGLFQAIKEFVYGVAAHDSARFAMKTRASMEHLFILITMGDMLGVPILPPYYSLRLLPYVVPQISTWKRRMLREKDFTDALA